jgi:DNA (cytosine-5)-methyltransferase 1
MVAMSRAHFQSNNYAYPEPIAAAALRPVRNFLDLQCKADSSFYFTPDSQYYDLFRQEIEKGGKSHVYQLRRSYVRKNMSDMCFTLMANMGEGGHNQPVIKDRWGIRKLTPRECARLQGYEDSWFQIPSALSKSQIYKQIGNSVTVPLVARLAEGIIRHVESLNGKGNA